MSYPPESCTYRVEFAASKRWFADEHELVAWFAQQEDAGAFDSRDPGGYEIFCQTPAGDVGIDYRHPRLIHARLWGRQKPHLGPRSAPGTDRPPTDVERAG